ncbi:MAG: alanine--tRNA ligase [Candidatus Omnitrophica bacterium]|nr:alanine--tRNA ligase [Candidatus Omnitrophota bacterium]MCM8776993.1 alanine--tRNA ligase [Candidatus Omnitrophota bacterium]
MKSSEIRSLYLDFFKGKGHSIVSGIGLIPFDDPTLLFTSAGMVQFKKFWATDVPLPYQRATTCQKCLRAGGKDSDIDKIGITGRHHTFFEMLGNFSFGDYFKEEAIEWAWEFVIERLKIPERDVWVSYYEKDMETKDIWKRFLPEERIIPLSAKDNFWGPAGDTGPCGPCTELYIDNGTEKGCGSDCKPGCECGRFLEFWNLVFPQYDKQKDGALAPLKRRGVDTGMGLERITRIMQKTPSNYETDLFLPIIKEIEKISGYSYDREEKKPSFRIMADHIRAAVFLIDENILPSNEARGYVLRRVIRRAEITGADLDIKEPFLHILSGVVVDIMADVYPSIKRNVELIKRVIQEEEEKYYYLINSASKNFYIAIEKLKGNKIPGDVAFKLYDTYGIPRDLLEDMASQRGLTVDWNVFERCLEQQREKARSSSDIGARKELIVGNIPQVETIFTGYEKTEDTARGIAVYKDEKRDTLYLVLDKTPFYPEKGGQIGDRGEIIKESSEFPVEFKVMDTRIDEKGIIYHEGHIVGMGSEDDFVGVKIKAAVDREFRKRVSINHTATHLLHYALREIIGKDVRQAGSFVGDTKLRFDFVCFKQLSDGDIEKMETFIQEKIFEDAPVDVEEMSLNEAIDKGAIALFHEKYGERVRVINIGDYHKEVCGGTHIERTGQIVLFKITGFSSIGQNLKRIEAVTYSEALKRMNMYRKAVNDISEKFNTDEFKILAAVEKLIQENEEKGRVIKRYEDILASQFSSKLTEKKESFRVDDEQAYFVSGLLNIGNGNFISSVADSVMKEIKEGVVFLGTSSEDVMLFVVKVSFCCSKKFPAREIVKEIAGIIEGQGGGSDVFARGNGKKPENYNKAVGRIKEILRIQR